MCSTLSLAAAKLACKQEGPVITHENMRARGRMWRCWKRACKRSWKR